MLGYESIINRISAIEDTLDEKESNYLTVNDKKAEMFVTNDLNMTDHIQLWKKNF
jgi:hypothetical protein